MVRRLLETAATARAISPTLLGSRTFDGEGARIGAWAPGFGVPQSPAPTYEGSGVGDDSRIGPPLVFTTALSPSGAARTTSARAVRWVPVPYGVEQGERYEGRMT